MAMPHGDAQQAGATQPLQAAQGAASGPYAQPFAQAHQGAAAGPYAQRTVQAQRGADANPYAQPFAQDQQGAPSSSEGSSGPGAKRRSPWMFVGISAGAVAVLACVIVALAIVLPDDGGSDSVIVGGSSGRIEGEASSSASSDEDPAAGTGSVGTSDTSTEGSASSADSGSLSLSDPSDYHSVNIYVSNFTEIGSFNDYDRSSATSEQLLEFALWHVYFNDPDGLETTGYAVTLPDGTNPRFRVTVDELVHYDELFLKRSFSISDLPSYRQQAFIDGCFYWGLTNPVDPTGIALSKSLEYLGDDRYRVQFDVYGKSMFDYTVTNEDLYGMTPDEAMAFFGTSGPIRTGHAIIEAGHSEAIAPYDLIEYRVENV